MGFILIDYTNSRVEKILEISGGLIDV